MSIKPINFKLEEERITDIKSIANAFHMTMTEVVNAALDDYLAAKKQDPFYRLTCNVEEASAKESKDILDSIDSLSDDDLKISSSKKFKA